MTAAKVTAADHPDGARVAFAATALTPSSADPDEPITRPDSTRWPRMTCPPEASGWSSSTALSMTGTGGDSPHIRAANLAAMPSTASDAQARTAPVTAVVNGHTTAVAAASAVSVDAVAAAAKPIVSQLVMRNNSSDADAAAAPASSTLGAAGPPGTMTNPATVARPTVAALPTPRSGKSGLAK
jgi:hypothetical protein